MSETDKTSFSAKEPPISSTMEAGERRKIRILPKLLKAAVLLFVLSALFLFGLDFKASAFFKKETQYEVLTSEESLRAQFQAVEEDIIRKNSYVYSSNYGFLNSNSGDSNNEIIEGFGGTGNTNGNILIQDIAFLSPTNPNGNTNSIPFAKQRGGIITYKVQSGDTLSRIATSFGISTNTILWANNLSYWGLIRPGDKLIILPTSGISHEVKNGDTLVGITKKYNSSIEKTITFNGLPADGSIKAGQKLIIVDGKKAINYSQPRIQLASYYRGPYSGKSHNFPSGQCTWYIAQKRYIPWGGNAKDWLYNAKRYGFQTGFEPTPGSIIVTKESWYGHVAYVESVSGNYVTISEMSMGHGIRHIRTLNKNDWRIRGYIY